MIIIYLQGEIPRKSPKGKDDGNATLQIWCAWVIFIYLHRVILPFLITGLQFQFALLALIIYLILDRFDKTAKRFFFKVPDMKYVC